MDEREWSERWGTLWPDIAYTDMYLHCSNSRLSPIHALANNHPHAHAPSVSTIIVYCIKRCNSPERFINEQMELGPGT